MSTTHTQTIASSAATMPYLSGTRPFSSYHTQGSPFCSERRVAISDKFELQTRIQYLGFDWVHKLSQANTTNTALTQEKGFQSQLKYQSGQRYATEFEVDNAFSGYRLSYRLDNSVRQKTFTQSETHGERQTRQYTIPAQSSLQVYQKVYKFRLFHSLLYTQHSQTAAVTYPAGDRISWPNLIDIEADEFLSSDECLTGQGEVRVENPQPEPSLAHISFDDLPLSDRCDVYTSLSRWRPDISGLGVSTFDLTPPGIAQIPDFFESKEVRDWRKSVEVDQARREDQALGSKDQYAFGSPQSGSASCDWVLFYE
ncbi:hypothetical protein ASPWEDRAFT_185740 [Aspergillus wentii DTO 134E9]|uniref:Uncharacterized protein n=1 Tax=Aspergillus wentii DTO 134E9 TaxID=1073089 RepID=A0A1L9REK7_ASPWE|nr:uncharacterized protein ASPWEDRAFT_185740 [Aspergillus wentii DTO 134E9]KAI9933593.1 hypothetical protein MW887_008066 [Aspergillus wentii]OJJ33345.1 hypothetical protein ASPWEDRAFT_185740 [Aspergillus wentii DTO 134E9]